MITADCSVTSPTPLTTVAIPWNYNDLYFTLWYPSDTSSFLSYNSSSSELVAVDYTTGKVAVLSSAPSPLTGIIRPQTTALDTATMTVFAVYGNDDQPPRYGVLTIDVKAGNITRQVYTQDNMDFDMMFLV